MTDYDDNERGAIWPNKKKESERHPDFTGSAKIDGKEFWISGWKRKPDANPNAPSLSLSFKLKDDQRGQALGTDMAAINVDDDVPF